MNMKLTDEAATTILASLENPPEPSDYLIKAKSLYESDVVKSFENKLLDGMQEMPDDFARILDDNFWDLL